MNVQAPAAEARHSSAPTGQNGLAKVALIGGAVAVALGVYANVHDPTGERIASFGFGSTLAMKAWFATFVAALVIVQVLTAASIWGRLPGTGSGGSAVAATHRWSGTAAFLLTLPVAYHCLWSLGFQTGSTRVLIHSFLGCIFYGAFASKMLLLRSNHLPARTLPFAGGVLVALLAGLWLTSSLWFFTNVGFPGV